MTISPTAELLCTWSVTMFKIALREEVVDTVLVEDPDGRLVNISLPEWLRYKQSLAEFLEINRSVKERYDQAE